LTSKTDRKGQTLQYVYDALNRLTSKNYPDSTGVEYVYDLVGKLQHVSDPTGSYGFAYDNMGRLLGTTTQYAFLPNTTFTNTLYVRCRVYLYVRCRVETGGIYCARWQHKYLQLPHAQPAERSVEFLGRIVRFWLRRAEPQNPVDASQRSEHELQLRLAL
jgi:YD repeat-containing protein